MADPIEPDKRDTPEKQSHSEKAEVDNAPPLDDAQTDRAVADIVAHEGDELLAEQDAAVAAAADKAGKQHHGLSAWWHNKKARWITLGIIGLAIVAFLAIPVTRYWFLNAIGVRVSSSLTVVDSVTSLPLKNVRVSIGEATAETDSSGKAKLTEVKLGAQTLKLQHPGFTSFEDKVTMGLGSNPLGNYPLKAVGLQYTLSARDYLTNQPIEGVEASSGDATAVSDKDGKIMLTVEDSNNDDLEVALSRSGYRSEQAVIKAQAAEVTTVRLLTSRRAVFVSKENGHYDVLSSDVDGQNRKTVLPGTSTETANIALVVSPNGDHAALVSTRDNQHDADGFLLTTLTLIDLSDNSTLTLAHAEQVQLVDWIGTRLVFEQVGADSSTAATHYSVISYDYANNSRVQLATGKHLNAVLSARGAIYYALAADSGDAAVHPALYRINPDATGKQTMLDKEVWTMYRTDYNTFSLQTGDGWYTLTLNSGTTASVPGPSAYSSRIYADNPDATQSLWVNTSQGLLQAYHVNDAKDNPAHTQAGLTYPVRWLTDATAIYRVVTGTETADYAVSTLGNGAPLKISDVSNSYGFTQGQ